MRKYRKKMETCDPKDLPEGYEEAFQHWKEFEQTHIKKYDGDKVRTVRGLYERLRETDGKYIRMGVLHHKDGWFYIRLQGREYLSGTFDQTLSTMIGMSDICHIHRVGRNIIIDLSFRSWNWVEK